MSDSPGLVDFAIGLVNSVFNLPDGQVRFFRNSNNRRTVINPAHQIFFGLVEMTFGLVHVSYSLPEWQAVKLTFFAPCTFIILQSYYKVLQHLVWVRDLCKHFHSMALSLFSPSDWSICSW